MLLLITWVARACFRTLAAENIRVRTKHLHQKVMQHNSWCCHFQIKAIELCFEPIQIQMWFLLLTVGNELRSWWCCSCYWSPQHVVLAFQNSRVLGRCGCLAGHKLWEWNKHSISKKCPSNPIPSNYLYLFLDLSLLFLKFCCLDLLVPWNCGRSWAPLLATLATLQQGARLWTQKLTALQLLRRSVLSPWLRCSSCFTIFTHIKERVWIVCCCLQPFSLLFHLISSLAERLWKKVNLCKVTGLALEMTRGSVVCTPLTSFQIWTSEALTADPMTVAVRSEPSLPRVVMTPLWSWQIWIGLAIWCDLHWHFNTVLGNVASDDWYIRIVLLQRAQVMHYGLTKNHKYLPKQTKSSKNNQTKTNNGIPCTAWKCHSHITS